MRAAAATTANLALILSTLAALALPPGLAAAPEARPAGSGPVPGEAPPATDTDTLRTLEPEDLFRLHRVGDVRFSPDGRWMAFERARPGDEGAVAALPDRMEPRSDVWVAAVGEGTPRAVTDGGSDGTGWFHPRWSPDGERLALLSVRENRVRAWIWERSSGELRRATDRAVHLPNVEPLLVHWLSPDELALAVRPEGAPERGRLLAEVSRPGLFTARRWRESWSGDEPTADVLDAGADSTRTGFHDRAEVLVVDTAGSGETVAGGRWGHVRPSPDGRRLATFALSDVPREGPLPWLGGALSLGLEPGVAELDGRGSPGGADGAAATGAASGPVRLDAPRHGTLRWAPDGSAYALLERPRRDRGDGPGGSGGTRVVRVDAASGEVDLIGHPDRRVAGFAWTGGSELLVRTRSADAGAGARSGWWRVRPGGEWERLTGGMDAVPERLVPAPGGAVGVAGGELWLLGDGDAPRALTREFGPEVRRVAWPAASRSPLRRGQGDGRRPGGPLALRAGSPGETELWTASLSGDGLDTLRRVPAPEGAGRPAEIAPGAAAAAFSRADSTGTWLLVGRHAASGAGPEAAEASASSDARPDGAVDTLVAEDRWIAGIETGEARRLTYEAGGRELTGWAILPPGREEGERHPTVVSVYPGLVHGDRPPPSVDPNTVWSVQAPQLLAARGYAVLLPSVPLPRGGAGPRESLDDAVIPAVDAAVEAGWADPAQVGLFGHSYGGFGVNHLVSLTDRFRAAVSSAGLSDLRSQYGTFDARSRHGHMQPPVLGQLASAAYMEAGQGRMGGPPWEAPDRYRRNSPLSHVDSVETPLLLIHGDRDFVAVQQAESLYTALLRRGQRARLVRYAGEPHVVRGRVNVVDMWDRIFGWYDRFLKGEVGDAGG